MPNWNFGPRREAAHLGWYLIVGLEEKMILFESLGSCSHIILWLWAPSPSMGICKGTLFTPHYSLPLHKAGLADAHRIPG